MKDEKNINDNWIIVYTLIQDYLEEEHGTSMMKKPYKDLDGNLVFTDCDGEKFGLDELISWYKTLVDDGNIEGGRLVDFGDGMTSESDGSPYNTIIINAIQEWNNNTDEECEIGINSKERRIIMSHFKNKNNYTTDDVLDWIQNNLELDENFD